LSPDQNNSLLCQISEKRSLFGRGQSQELSFILLLRSCFPWISVYASAEERSWENRRSTGLIGDAGGVRSTLLDERIELVEVNWFYQMMGEANLVTSADILLHPKPS